MLFRWFVGMNMDEPVWDATVFTKNRDRPLEGEVAKEFLLQVVQQAQARGLASDEHFTVDGTLIEAWASVKSFQRKDQKNPPPPDDPGNPTVDFHGEKRSNETHESKSDPDAKLARKGNGKEAKLSYNGNLLVENRNGIILNTEVFQANGTAERDAALVMLGQIPGGQRVTVAADKGYDTKDFVAECRHLRVTPHVAQNHKRPGGRAIDARTTRHALMRKVRHRGIFKVGWVFTFAARCLQPRADADSGDAVSSVRISRGIRVPERRKQGVQGRYSPTGEQENAVRRPANAKQRDSGLRQRPFFSNLLASTTVL